MLRKARITLATLFFAGVTLLLLDITGTLHLWLGWMAKVQFLPAVLALNVVAIAVVVLLTLIFGRLYCSVICPLGVMQDIFAHFGAKSRKKNHKKAYAPRKEHRWMRYGVWVLFVASIVLGVHALVALLAPYSAYGRICQSLFQPVYIWFNNIFAGLAEKSDSYLFYGREVWLRSLPVLIVALVTLIGLAITAWFTGREYCNTICPVGTTLGFLSRFSLLKPMVDESKCVGCGKCQHACKAGCLDSKNKAFDYSRCVVCFNCIDDCHIGAIKYKWAYPRKKSAKPAESTGADTGRRAFMTGAAIVAGSAVANAQNHGGLAQVALKKAPERKTPVTPPGSVSLKNMYDHCTACQLCVAACPNNVLRPSKSFEHFMQPEMSYERGYCRPECTRCSEVCPSGAILKIDQPEKSSIQIGHAVWTREACVVVSDGVKCGNCARHCPVGAIRMVKLNPDDPDSLRIPTVNEERCIGCGACENLCPSKPQSAIHVEGHEVHKTV